MKKAIGILYCLAMFMTVAAQDMATCPDSIFRRVMRNLVSKGNCYYDISNTDGMRQMLDAIGSNISKRSRNGRLSVDDSLEFTADWYKLEGSYHYENSYYDSSSLARAHESYQKSLDIYKGHSIFNGNLQCEPMIHRELGILYYKEENYEEAYRQMKQAYDAFEGAAGLGMVCDDDPDYLDIQTQMAMCQARMGKTKESIAMMDKLIRGYSPSDVRYGEALRKKAKILMFQEENGGKSGRAVALACYKSYFAQKKKDALKHFLGMSSKEREMYWMRIRPFVVDCYRLEDADAGFLYDVSLFAKGLLLQLDSAGGGRQAIHATWQMVQEQLEPDACAIEFVQYEKYGQQQMGALVLKKTGVPLFVKMAQPDSVMNYKTGLYSVGHRLYSTNGTLKNALYKDTTGVFRMIWNEPLLSVLGKAKKVYFAPDGYIHQIAIEYMIPQEAGDMLTYRLSSTRSLLDEKTNLKGSRALIVGGVDYLHANGRNVGNNDSLAYRFLKKSRFETLKNSLGEVRHIADCRLNSNDTLIIGENATEQVFRQICGRYQIIHVSTHGVFSAARTPQGTDLKPCLSERTLSQSVIALSGIQKNLDDWDFNAQLQDGALSAKEISVLDMKNTQLVVLACCQTGLGYVSPDGVYGIQRGLKNAGAKAIVCALWDVDDNATTFFMGNFHRYINEGETICQAFRSARDDMSKIMEAGGDDFSEPCDKDAFILIDALE